MTTFEVVDGVLRGYWGPAAGFEFVGETTTAFTAVFNTSGNYTVNIYAIQVPPVVSTQ